LERFVCVKNAIKVHTLPQEANMAMLSINAKDVEEVARNISRMKQTAPALVEGLFSGAAIAIAITAGSQLEENKVLGAIEGLRTLLP
jgi:hypothetical protein